MNLVSHFSVNFEGFSWETDWEYQLRWARAKLGFEKEIDIHTHTQRRVGRDKQIFIAKLFPFVNIVIIAKSLIEKNVLFHC